MNETVTIGIDAYASLVRAERDYQILARTILRTANINRYDRNLMLNDIAILEVMKSLGLNVEGTRETLIKEMEEEEKKEEKFEF
jgi:hypothetical protein